MSTRAETALKSYRDIRKAARDDHWSAARTKRTILERCQTSLSIHLQFNEDVKQYGYDTAVTNIFLRSASQTRRYLPDL